MRVAMGSRLTISSDREIWRCVLAGRRADGAVAFTGGDLGRRVMWMHPGEYHLDGLGWFDDAELVELTVAG